jgi:hypothetical protein
MPLSLKLTRTPTAAESDLFRDVLHPLEMICRPALDSKQVLVYFQLLEDLPAEAVYAAALEIAGSRLYPTWPTPGEIRSVAVRLLAPQLTAAEAWRTAQVAARSLGEDNASFINGIPAKEWNQKVWDDLPPAVASTLRLLGGKRLAETQQLYANFRDEYERQIVAIRRPLMLPGPAKELIAKLAAASKAIGVETVAGKKAIANENYRGVRNESRQR